MIRGLQSQITDTKQQNQDVQREWLKMQTSLVTVMAGVESLNDELHENTAKLTIYQQRRLRLDSSIENMNGEVRTLKKEIEGMHGEMTRLNRLISQNKALQEKLASATFNQEKEFVAELRELETQSVQRDTQVRRLQTERAQMLWEKKIQLSARRRTPSTPRLAWPRRARWRRRS